MEDRGYSSFCEGDSVPSDPLGPRCKSLYTEWKCPAYYPYHAYQKHKAKSDVSHHALFLLVFVIGTYALFRSYLPLLCNTENKLSFAFLLI